MKVSYPFAAVPNQVCRGGHGAINIAVLAVLLSHGRTTAAASTLAKEVGCSRTSIFKSIQYWTEEGPKYGIELVAKSGKKDGNTTVYEVNISRMEDGGGVQPANGGCSPVEHRGVQPANTKKNPLKKNHEEDNLAPAAQDGQKAVVVKERSDADIIAVFEVFQQSVNPTINYANRTMRAAAAALVKQHGVEKVMAAARFAVAHYGEPMFPQVSNPHELREKMPRLIAAHGRGQLTHVKIS